ncbi:MAG: hypothetical protein ACYSU0_01445 [Planctomycetota bacterium]
MMEDHSVAPAGLSSRRARLLSRATLWLGILAFLCCFVMPQVQMLIWLALSSGRPYARAWPFLTWIVIGLVLAVASIGARAAAKRALRGAACDAGHRMMQGIGILFALAPLFWYGFTFGLMLCTRWFGVP